MTNTPAAPAPSAPKQETAGPITPQTGSRLPAATPSWSLEALSAENAARIGLLAQVGEGIFDDHIQVSPDGKVLAVATAAGIRALQQLAVVAKGASRAEKRSEISTVTGSILDFSNRNQSKLL